MADPVERICYELGVCQEEAICYLDGFRWNLDSAMEACRSKTLPLPSITVPLRVIDSRRSLNPEEEQSRNQLIASFCEAAVGTSPKEAVFYLERSNWDVNLAIGCFIDERRPTPSQRNPNLQNMPRRLISPSQGVKIGSSSSDSLKGAGKGPNIAGAIPLMASSRVQIQERSSPAQIREEELLPPKVDRICDAIRVCREEALYYLEGFNWDLPSAMEACRSKTLPPVKVKSLPGQEQLPPEQEQLPPELMDELINSFCDATKASQAEAVACLNHCKWNGNDAVGYFMDKRFGNFYSQRISEDDHSTIGQSNSQWPSEGDRSTTGFSEDVTSKALASERLQNICPPVPLMGLPSQSQLQAPLESSSSSMEVDRTDSLKEAGEEHIPEAIPLMASAQVKIQNIQESRSPAQIREVKENSQSEQPSQLNETLISSFCNAAGGATREVAIGYLKLCNWDVNQAIGLFIDGVSREEISAAIAMSSTENRGLHLSSMGLPSQSQFQASLGSQNQDYSSSSIIPGMASSQVDGKAVEEDSSTETFPDPFAIQDRTIVGPRAAQTTITITIILADGGSEVSVNIPFRSNQTVRDIHDAIDELTPDNDRKYYLQSMAGVDCKDMNMTVYGISTGGSTILLQLFSDQ